MRSGSGAGGIDGVRQRAFESVKCERLYREDILDVLDLTSHAEEFRIEFNTIRPHRGAVFEPAAGGTHRPRQPAHPHL